MTTEAAATKGKKKPATPPPAQEAPPSVPAPTGQTTALTTAAPVGQGSWGSEGLDMSDVKIPKLLLMQGQSELVAQQKANIGDIIRSTNGEVVVPRGGGNVHFIPLLSRKTWRVMEMEGAKFEFRRIEPMTEENKNRPLEWEEGTGDKKTKWRADRIFGVFALLTSDIEREAKALLEGGDPDAACIPVLIEFARTSYNAGKDIATHIAHARKFNQPPAYWGLSLSTEAQSNDLGHYVVFKVSKGMRTTPENLKLAYDWYQVISAGKAQVDEVADPAAGSTDGPRRTDTPAAEANDDY